MTAPDLVSFRADWRARGRAERTLREYLRILTKVHARHPLPLDFATARTYVAERMDEVAAATVYPEVRALKACHRFLADEDGQPSPLQKLRSPKVPESVDTPVASEHDVQRLLATCGTARYGRYRDRRDGALIAVLASSGMRRGELAQVKLDEVHLDVGVLVIPFTRWTAVDPPRRRR